jgi:hypothetical protein
MGTVAEQGDRVTVALIEIEDEVEPATVDVQPPLDPG